MVRVQWDDEGCSLVRECHLAMQKGLTCGGEEEYD